MEKDKMLHCKDCINFVKGPWSEFDVCKACGLPTQMNNPICKRFEKEAQHEFGR